MSDQLALAFAQELASGIRSALGPDLVAAYLYGSAVAGGFVPGTSDIDLLVVVERDLDEATAAALRTFQGSVVQRHAEWENRLELVYVGRGTLSDFRAGGLLGVISPGEPFHVRRGVELWIGNFYLVRETGVTVFGPPPADTIPPVSWAEFLTEIRRYADEVRSRDLRNATPGDRAYCVLTMCRALATVRDDRTYSKEEGAALVRSWMPEWAWLIDEASSCRLARGDAGFADERAIEAAVTFVSLVGDAISDIARLGDAILRVTAVGANQPLGTAGGAAEGSSERSRAMTHHRQGRSVTKPVRMPIGAVILDMDGVVRHWRPGPTHAVDKTYGLPEGTINGIALTVPESYLGVLGVCSFADWLDAIARELPIHVGVEARREAVRRWASYRGDVDRATMAIVEQLRTRVPVHVLSNAHDCFMDDIRQLGLSDAFDSFHYSAEMKLAKPDPAAYMKVLDRIGMPANRCVFADDHPENVVAARSVGMLAYDYTTPAAFAEAISPLLAETQHS